jgi:DNA repair exonuclease SbcCD ATPase subunit
VESLDVAIDALEQLQAATTMVGVITHLPQMADRLPQGVEVVKESAGSRIVRR